MLVKGDTIDWYWELFGSGGLSHGTAVHDTRWITGISSSSRTSTGEGGDGNEVFVHGFPIHVVGYHLIQGEWW